MIQTDIPFLPATELSALTQRREVSPVEATEAYLDRIDSLDFKFNSYLNVCHKEALQAAQEAEQAIAQGNYLGPMHGVPVAVKDQLWSKGIRSTGGSYIQADFIPDEDATALANLKKAGAILLGKTNMPEFALGGPHRFSVPRNPWDLNMQAGRSSSGSGAATAAFLCATSLVEDTGGSIRFPAACCGVVGLRPSWGRVSRYGLMRGVWSMDTVGPISRSVSDAAITLAAIAGHDPKDPYMWSTPVPDYSKGLDSDVRGMRAGLILEQIDSEVAEPEVREAVLSAVSVLGKLGVSVEEVSLPLTKHARMITSVRLAAEPPSNHWHWMRERLQDYSYESRVRLLMGSIIPAQVYYKAQKLRTLVSRQVHKALEEYAVLVLPTVSSPAPRIEEGPVIAATGGAPRPPTLLTSAFNLAGAPAISLPCGFSSQGLPIGLQIAGPPGGEETVLKVAHAYERSTPWHTMRPPNA